MRQHRIWVNVASDAYSPNSSKSFGVRTQGVMDFHIGTSSTHSNAFCTVEISTTYEDGIRIDELSVDGTVVKKAKFIDGEKEPPLIINPLEMLNER